MKNWQEIYTTIQPLYQQYYWAMWLVVGTKLLFLGCCLYFIHQKVRSIYLQHGIKITYLLVIYYYVFNFQLSDIQWIKLNKEA